MLVGQQLGPFTLLKELGAGAMGAVYLARYEKTGQKVAVKLMAPGLGSNETAVARFQREAEILKQLRHPHIVRLFGHGKSHGTLYYAMEYLQGESLDHVLQRRGRLTWEEAIQLGQQLCLALQHAHEQGIVHRDLKPSNLMILKDGTLKLTDFGIAKDLDVTQLTSANCTVGTAAYMSPEQCRGERDLTYKSDLYSLGVVLYELLTGRKPFQADNAMDMFVHHVSTKPERPSQAVLDIPVWLDTIICQLLEKKPEHRPLDAATVHQALARVLEKVTAQQSAGLDMARKRVMDRLPGEAKSNLDETDKEAARTLLRGGRSRKKKRRPLYERLWFQAGGVLALLAGVAALLYLTFRPPSQEELFARVQHVMQQSAEEQEEARDRGVIKEYLDHYGRQDDAKTAQVWQWVSDIDQGLRERQLLNRFRRDMTPKDEAESIAFAALRQEESGDLDAARERWESLLKYKELSANENHALGLVADKRLKELQAVTTHEQELAARVQELRLTGKADPPEADSERQALEALRYELFGDVFQAHRRWDSLKQLEKDAGRRGLFLLAASHTWKLKAQLPETPEKEFREELVKKRLQEAATLAETQPQEALAIHRDIVALYDRERFPELKEAIDFAAQVVKQYQPGKAAR